MALDFPCVGDLDFISTAAAAWISSIVLASDPIGIFFTQAQRQLVTQLDAPVLPLLCS